MNFQICLCFLLCFSLSAANIVESTLKQCRNHENDIDSCLIQLMEDIRPFLSKGLPELKIPVLEPMSLENLNFSQQEGGVNFRALFRDVLVSGFSNFTLKSIKTNIDKMELSVSVYIPVLRVSGNYNLAGNIILLPVTGDGPFRATLHEINANLIGKIVVKNEGGKERLGIANTNIDFQLRSARSRLRNLFNGDPILGETVNHFINTNDQIILQEIKPAVSKEVSLLVQNIMDSALSTLPVDLVIRNSRPSSTTA